MRFAVLGSGSKGNCLVIEGGGRLILVDCGYGPREIKRRLQHLDADIRKVDALLLTHGHGDHVKGAKQVAGALGIPTYATDETKRFCAGFTGLRNHIAISTQQPFTLGGLTVTPQATPHDAPGSVCFVVDDGDEAVGYCTDLGTPAAPVARALSVCDALVLEHNHDVEMLRNGPYTPALKRRIESPRGHLSNAQGAELLRAAMTLGGNKLTRVLLAHLSEVNNTPALALAAARPVVDGMDVEVAIAPQHHPTGWLRARRRRTSPAIAVHAAPTETEAAFVAPALARAAGVAVPPAPVVGARHAAMERQLALFAAAQRS